MKRLNEIWARCQLPRLIKELEWRQSEFIKLKKVLNRQVREAQALKKVIAQRRIK